MAIKALQGILANSGTNLGASLTGLIIKKGNVKLAFDYADAVMLELEERVNKEENKDA